MTEEDRFTKAYEEHADAIFRYCFYRVYDREKAREFMQEAFTRAWRQIANGKKVVNIRAFIYTTARNLIIDHSRKKKESSLDDLMDAGVQFEDTEAPDLHMRLDGEAVLKTLDQLEPHYQEVIIFRYVEGLKPREIAEVTGENKNVISVRIHRALKQLKNILHDHE